MKSLERLFSCMVAELGDQLGVTTDRDIAYAISRYRKEGYAFFGVTLASFGKWFEKSLANEVIGDTPPGFRTQGAGRLPSFLKGFTSLLFTSDGVLKADIDPLAVYAIRQITLAWSKCEFPMTQIMREQGAKRYLATEDELREWDRHFSECTVEYQDLEEVFDALFSDTLNELTSRLLALDTIPRHGPGYTAERLIGNAKWRKLSWTVRLNRVFPYQEFIRVNEKHDLDHDSPDILTPRHETPVRVTFVPKTIDKCRTIAMEPTYNMYLQQAILRTLVDAFRQPAPYGSVYDFVKLHRQEQNRMLARKGSITGKLATLDLSDASDRLSNQLVRSLFSRYPHIYDVLDASRSRKADVLGKVVRLSKYASMGSALCFPIETMVFLAIAITGCLAVDKDADESPINFTDADIRRLKGSVSVYGDDIIVPTSAAPRVAHLLETFGFKVNVHKSFMNGKFRESCGADWYDGSDVSISRLRQPIPATRSEFAQVASLLEFRNSLFQKRGLWKTAEYLDGILEEMLEHYPPVDCNVSEVLGPHTFSDPHGSEHVYWDTRLHRYVVRGVKVKSVTPINEVDGWYALLKYFTERGDEPLSVDALTRSGRADNVLKRIGWGAPK